MTPRTRADMGRLARTHLIRTARGVGDYSTTFCGLKGWPAGSDEFDTAEGRRFEAMQKNSRQVTCRRCLRASSPAPQSQGE